MVALLKCPEIQTKKIINYLEQSNFERKFSNFGHCETRLKKRFSSLLGVNVDSVVLGSSATSLLMVACELGMQISDKYSNYHFPAYSFFSTFSLATHINRMIEWYDLELDTFLPVVIKNPKPKDLIFLTIPYGRNLIETYFDYAKGIPATVVIDAAACLPGIIYNKQQLSNIPENVIVVFSLHATKLISAGEGGLLVFGRGVSKNAKQLTNFGISANRTQEWSKSYNAKMSEFNAAAALASLDDFTNNAEKIMSVKKKIKLLAKDYNNSLFGDIDVPTLTLNMISSNSELIFHSIDRNRFPLRRWWSLSVGLAQESYPNSHFLYNSLLGIPFDWTVKEDYLKELFNIVNEIEIASA